ncbi:hypothetical protein AN478_11880 [Thiohalorhabdus denitrificans]|uniref:Cytochrome c554 and c-prime n=2 Tax=Thiohalorhabdus denitrificans TaxID=381306 RepID=A0A0P9CJI7_9GAMM|nr:hypothetical protein AN478_11880 [Thiohalorhabdus denitrificans]SCX79894.1 Cytochrome c554 and c-prime [Thiohalorhabdus denitrificans]
MGGRGFAMLGILVVAVAGGSLAWWALQPGAAEEKATAAFLDRFWTHPIPAQGQPPEGFTPLEASLDPGACRSCHPDRFAEWDASLHSQAMGAGIWWQFRVKSPEQVKECARCHAPMAEQLALMGRDLGWEDTGGAPPEHVPADLHREGLVCAACHVRGHKRFGPPAEDPLPAERAPHDGFVATEAYRSSRFCAECHQFPEDGPKLNGKLRENTYEEWRASRYAEEGVTCQSCHMPGQKHRWKGIHDPGMVREAVTVELDAEPAGEGAYRVAGEVANTGAGHKFPTYLTPKVYARLVLEDGQGKVREELDRAVIGWGADVEMTEELYDTRLSPGEAVRLQSEARLPDQAAGWRVALHLDVAPQEHYERLFRYMFQQADKMSAETVRTLEQALKEAVATRFRALSERVALDGEG